MKIDPSLVARFAADLDAVLAPGERVGVAVSGGPDSVALLLLVAAARPGLVDVATVDHAFRQGSRAEAEGVAALCERLGVPHAILAIEWPTPPVSAVQEQARTARYAALGDWAQGAGLGTIATGHHADDQAETLLMRLARGAGVRGLAGMRASAPVPGHTGLTLVRPLLGWRRTELAAVVAAAGISAVDDPSNHDDRFERVRIRAALAEHDWLDAAALARSAAHLAAADEAIDHAVEQAWGNVRVEAAGESGVLSFDPGNAPPEIRRRLVAKAIAALAHEGDGGTLRGREVDQLLATIDAGGSATLRGVRASGGRAGEIETLRFSRSPPRR